MTDENTLDTPDENAGTGDETGTSNAQATGAEGNEDTGGSPDVVSTEVVTFSTLLIEVATGNYPVSLDAVKARWPASWPQQPLLADIESYGYAKVEDVPKPSGDVVTEGAPVQQDGKWVRVWNVRDWNDEEKFAYLMRKQTNLTAQVMALRDQDCANGMPYSIDDGANTFHVQIRPSDKINLLGLNLEAQYAQKDGTTDAIFKFRSFENKSYMLTPDQMYAMTRASLACILAIYDASWALKDQIDTATAIEELPAIPESLMPTTEALKKM